MNTSKVPVAFFVFNRPDLAAQVFEQIRAYRPSRLLFISDGPRDGMRHEADLVNACRALASRVDWPCETLSLFSSSNLGCRLRIQSGLDWVFSQTEEAIILEDDCVPSQTFFRYCSEMLERYRHDHRVMMISGTNPAPKITHEFDIYFSSYPHIWGWATWRRSWNNYQREMFQIEDVVAQGAIHCDMKRREVNYWIKLFRNVQSRRINTWDAQMVYQAFRTSAFTVFPSKNQVHNVGFRSDATHTKTAVDADLGGKLVEMTFPLHLPDQLVPSRVAELARKKRERIAISVARRIVNRLFKCLKK